MLCVSVAQELRFKQVSSWKKEGVTFMGCEGKHTKDRAMD